MIPVWTEYLQPVGLLLLPVAIVTIVLSVAAAFLAARATRQSNGVMLLYLSPFAWLGGVTGVIAGSSQQAIVGAFVTGMLTVVAGLFSFIFAKDALSEWRPVLAIAVVLLCINAVIGLSLGGIHKKDWDSYERERAIWGTTFEKIHVPALAVQRHYELCRSKINSANISQCDSILTK
jgi:hypothetical protein